MYKRQFQDYTAGNLDLLNRSLVQQAVPKELLAGTKKMIGSPDAVASRKRMGEYPIDMAVARDNLLRAWKAGVTLITCLLYTSRLPDPCAAARPVPGTLPCYN